jgi:hypothetical protein
MAAFEYFRVSHDLVQEGGVREYRVVHLRELSFEAQSIDERLVFAREREHVFATTIVAG